MKKNDKGRLLESLVPQEKRGMVRREKDVGRFVSNLSRGGGKAKVNRHLGVSLTGSGRRY